MDPGRKMAKVDADQVPGDLAASRNQQKTSLKDKYSMIMSDLNINIRKIYLPNCKQIPLDMGQIIRFNETGAGGQAGGYRTETREYH